MSTSEFDLGPVPAEGSSPRVVDATWGGVHPLEDVRGYGISQIDPALGEAERDAAVKAVNDTMYGLMMVLDGVTGQLGDSEQGLRIDAMIRLTAKDKMLAEEILAEGDEIWRGWGGHYGDDPVAERRAGA